MKQLSDSYFKTVQDFVLKNLQNRNVIVSFGKSHTDFGYSDKNFFKLEALKTLFDKANYHISNLGAKKLDGTQKDVFYDLQEFTSFPFEDSESNKKLFDVLKESNNGFVHSTYIEKIFIKFPVFDSGKVRQVQISAFPEVSDFIKDLSFELLASKIKKMKLLDAVITSNNPKRIPRRKTATLSSETPQNQR
ncbi:MAG TPA: hypothetical protein PKJ33_00100 [Alphaproteobacteria bacterium]|nr:hypothetical protein [Alphaproteobacteria bacterium]